MLCTVIGNHRGFYWRILSKRIDIRFIGNTLRLQAGDLFHRSSYGRWGSYSVEPEEFPSTHTFSLSNLWNLCPQVLPASQTLSFLSFKLRKKFRRFKWSIYHLLSHAFDNNNWQERVFNYCDTYSKGQRNKEKKKCKTTDLSFATNRLHFNGTFPRCGQNLSCCLSWGNIGIIDVCHPRRRVSRRLPSMSIWWRRSLRNSCLNDTHSVRTLTSTKHDKRIPGIDSRLTLGQLSSANK